MEPTPTQAREVELTESVPEAEVIEPVAETPEAEAAEVAPETTDAEPVESAAETTEVARAEAKDKKRMSTGLKVLLWLLVLLLLAAGGAAGWVLWTDYQKTDIVPEGISFNGASMAGYTSEQAEKKVAEVFDTLNKISVAVSTTSVPATSTFRAGEPRATIGEFVVFNPEQVVKEIVDARAQSDIITRARHDFLGEPIVHDAKLTYEISEDNLIEFIEGLGTHYQDEPVNAALSQTMGKIQLSKSKDGFVPDAAASKEAARSAILGFLENYDLSASNVEFDFVGQTLAPEITTEKLEKIPAIVVSLSKRRVTLYNGETVVKSYPCAIGTSSHPTPVGNWRITEKRRNPVWRNPGSAWAKDMPASIGPSPSAPLGSRALNLDAKNIRLHGTSNIGSVGTAASHGCLRMYNKDIIDLFDRVSVGTKVFIIR